MFNIPQINYNFTANTRILIFADNKMNNWSCVSPQKIVITENIRATKKKYKNFGFNYSGELQPKNIFENSFYLSEGLKLGCIKIDC